MYSPRNCAYLLHTWYLLIFIPLTVNRNSLISSAEELLEWTHGDTPLYQDPSKLTVWRLFLYWPW